MPQQPPANSKREEPPRRSDVNAAARVARALELRKAGATYDAIARQCSYGSRAAAYHAVQRELARTLQEPADDLRRLEAERLNDLYRAMAPKALGGDAYAVDRCLRIMERRAALLGIDAQPTEVQQTNVRRIYERR